MTGKFVVENQIWDKAETMSRDELANVQATRLKETVKRVANVPFYKEKFAAAGISEDSIKSIDDIRKLPFTTKADLRNNYPLGFLAVDRSEVVRYHGSSGTTGKPTFVAYTKNDLELWADLCARFLAGGGLKKEHTVQIAFGYGLFTGGFGLHYGIERVGASVIPASSGNTKKQLMLMQDMHTDALVCTPSYALTIAEYIKHNEIDRSSLQIKYAHLGGEPWSEDMRVQIEKDLEIRAFNNYGLSEVIGPGVSGECAARCGMHIQEDHFIVECLDPETLEPVEDGQQGELVFSAVTKEAMPIIRYRTRDIASITTEKCACGRTTARMDRVIGRTDDMLIIRGVNVFPSQIEEALLQVEGTAPHYLIEVERPETLDQLTVHVEVNPNIFSDRMDEMQVIKQNIDKEIQSITGLRAKINLVQPQSLERFVGKAKRVVDHRTEVGH